MDWHCGLLDDPSLLPEQRNPIRDRNWHTLPAGLERELRIWLAMPGFSLRYHVETLEREPREIKKFMGGYAELEEDILLNWASASREDCLRLGWIRPLNGHVPLITQCQIRRDYLSRKVLYQKELAAEYRVYPSTVNKLCWGIPDEWDVLPPRLKELVARELYFSSSSPAHAKRLKALQRPRTPAELPPGAANDAAAAFAASFAKRGTEQPSTEKSTKNELSPEQIENLLDGALKYLGW